ncbi:hypothetical protein BU24DRAFT_451646 [Aaosphaeria arxii CBS 175.79]|uniref:Uncharacterized protein n=1 Tax=Aaosphaeria arxii CBS 175.79 TaxID=1450172 RepID=A0A6A5XP34_9PLEO|nr:uncharacterized protein BU24DRAFT_451646 [Aaosphaeria arxii CBS 175.79]KAF2014666.1 hypothetical protein BU24DRAFT_451646 [Aaosphaeria arxii CBS 175.79]
MIKESDEDEIGGETENATGVTAQRAPKRFAVARPGFETPTGQVWMLLSTAGSVTGGAGGPASDYLVLPGEKTRPPGDTSEGLSPSEDPLERVWTTQWHSDYCVDGGDLRLLRLRFGWARRSTRKLQSVIAGVRKQGSITKLSIRLWEIDEMMRW